MFSPEVFLEKLQQELNNVCIERINFRTISSFYRKFCNFFQACNRLTEQQVKQLADCCVTYIECIRSYVENHSELTKKQVETIKQFIQIAGDIPKLAGIKNEYMKWIATPLLEKVIESDIRSWFGKEVLKNYNRAIQGTKKDLRNDIAERNIVYLCKLADLLCCCGDFDYQVTLMETIFRMCSMDQINCHARTLFPESEILQNGICNVNEHNFDVDMRVFLNTVNSKFKSVLSIESQYVLLDNIQVRAPKDTDRNNLPLWVDFNLVAETITILCDQNSLKTSNTEDTESEEWEIITINISNITHVLMSSLLVEDAARALGSVLYFKLTPPCTVLFASSHAAAQATDFKLAILKCPELIQLETVVLPKMFGDKFNKLATSSQENSPVENQELNVQPKLKRRGVSMGYKPLKTQISICRPCNVSSSASDAMSLKNRLQEVENYSFDKEKKFICQSPKISNIKELVAKYNSEEKFEKKDVVGETGKMDRCETFDEAKSPENSKFVSDTTSIDGNSIEETDMQPFEASDNVLQLMNCSSNSVLALEFATSFEQIDDETDLSKEQNMNQKHSRGKKIWSNAKKIQTEDEPKISLCVPSNHCNTLCDNVQVIEGIEPVEESDKEQSKTQGYGGEKKICKNSKNSIQTEDEPKISLCVPSNHSNILRDNIQVIDGIEPVEESDKEQSKTQGYGGEKKICKNSKNSIQTEDEPKISLCVPSNHYNILLDNVQVIDGIEPVEESDKEQSKTQGYGGEKKICKNSKNSIQTEDEPKISLCVPSNHYNILLDNVQVIDGIEPVEESDKEQSKTQGYGGEKKICKNSKNSIQTEDEPKISLCVPSNHYNILLDNVQVIDGIEPVEESDKEQSKTQGYGGEKKICKNSKNSIQTEDEPKISLCVPSNHYNILLDNVQVIDGIEPVEESDKEQSKTQGYGGEKKICKNSKNSIQTEDEPKISLCVPSNHYNILLDNVQVIDGIEPVEESDEQQSKTQGYGGEKKICKNFKNSIQPEDEPKISLCVPSNHSNILRDNVQVIDGIEPVEESDKEQSKTQAYGGEKKICKNSKNSIQTEDEPKISLCVPSNHNKILLDNVQVIDGIEPVEESDKEQSKTQGYGGEKKICKNSKNSIQTKNEPKISLCVPSKHCNILRDNVQIIDGIEPVAESNKEQSMKQRYGREKKICSNAKNIIKTEDEPKISVCVSSNHSNILRDNVQAIEPVEESEKEQSMKQRYGRAKNICSDAKNSIQTEDEPKISLCVPLNHSNILRDNIEGIEPVEENEKEKSCNMCTTKDSTLLQENLELKYVSECIKSDEELKEQADLKLDDQIKNRLIEKSPKKIKSSKEVIKVKWLAPKRSMSKLPIVDKTETLKQKKLLKSSVKKFKVANNSQSKPKRKTQQKLNDDNHTEINEDKENSSVSANTNSKEVLHKAQTIKKIENIDNSFHAEMLPETNQNEIKSSEPSIVDDIKTIKNKSFRARASKLQTKNIKINKKQITKEKQSTVEKSLKVEVIKGHNSKNGNKKLNERTSYSIPADINKICVIEYRDVDVEDNTLPIHKNQYDSDNMTLDSLPEKPNMDRQYREEDISKEKSSIKKSVNTHDDRKSCDKHFDNGIVIDEYGRQSDLESSMVVNKNVLSVKEANIDKRKIKSADCTALEDEKNTSALKNPEKQNDNLFELAKLSREEAKTEDKQPQLEKSSHTVINDAPEQVKYLSQQSEGMANKNECIIKKSTPVEWVLKKCSVVLSKLNCQTVLLKNTENNLKERLIDGNTDLSDGNTELCKEKESDIFQNKDIKENEKEIISINENFKEKSREKTLQNKPIKLRVIKKNKNITKKTEKNEKSNADATIQNECDVSQNCKMQDVQRNLESSFSEQQEYNAINKSEIISNQLGQVHDIENYNITKLVRGSEAESKSKPEIIQDISKTQMNDTAQIHLQSAHKYNTTVENELIFNQENDSLMPNTTCIEKKGYVSKSLLIDSPATPQSETRTSQKRKLIDNDVSDQNSKSLTEINVVTDDETPKIKKSSKKGVSRRLFNLNAVYTVMESNKGLVMNKSQIINTENSVQDKDISKCNDLQSELMQNDDINQLPITKEQEEHIFQNEIINKADVNSNTNEHNDYSINNMTAQKLSKDISEINIESPRKEMGRQQINNSEKSMQANMFEQFTKEKTSNSVINIDADPISTAHRMDSSTNLKDSKIASSNHTNKNSEDEYVLKTPIKNTSHILQPPKRSGKKETYGTRETNAKLQKALSEYCEKEDEFLFDTNVRDSEIATNDTNKKTEKKKACKTPGKSLPNLLQPPKKIRKEALPGYFQKEDGFLGFKKQLSGVMHKSKFELCLESVLESLQEIHTSSSTYVKKSRRSLKDAKYKSLKSNRGKPKKSIDKSKRRATTSNHKTTLKQQLKMVEKEKKLLSINIQQSHITSPLSYADIDNPPKKTSQVMTDSVSKMQQNTFTQKDNVKNRSSIDISSCKEINGTVNHSEAPAENFSSGPSSAMGTKRKRAGNETAFEKDELILDWNESGTASVAMEGLKFVAELVLRQHNQMYEVLSKVLLPLKTDNEQHLNAIYTIANEFNRRLKTYFRQH